MSIQESGEKTPLPNPENEKFNKQMNFYSVTRQNPVLPHCLVKKTTVKTKPSVKTAAPSDPVLSSWRSRSTFWGTTGPVDRRTWSQMVLVSVPQAQCDLQTSLVFEVETPTRLRRKQVSLEPPRWVLNSIWVGRKTDPKRDRW